MTEQELRYTVLIYEDELGTWVKIPEFDLQCLTDDIETGIDLLEDDLHFRLELRRSVAFTARQPSSGSVTMNRLAVPLRTYS